VAASFGYNRRAARYRNHGLFWVIQETTKRVRGGVALEAAADSRLRLVRAKPLHAKRALAIIS
jgi:hypothetical protein